MFAIKNEMPTLSVKKVNTCFNQFVIEYLSSSLLFGDRNQFPGLGNIVTQYTSLHVYLLLVVISSH